MAQSTVQDDPSKITYSFELVPIKLEGVDTSDIPDSKDNLYFNQASSTFEQTPLHIKWEPDENSGSLVSELEDGQYNVQTLSESPIYNLRSVKKEYDTCNIVSDDLVSIDVQQVHESSNSVEYNTDELLKEKYKLKSCFVPCLMAMSDIEATQQLCELDVTGTVSPRPESLATYSRTQSLLDLEKRHGKNSIIKATNQGTGTALQANPKTAVNPLHGDRPFICEGCSAGFKRKNALVAHMATHSKVKPYKCKDCSYASKRKSSLSDHTRIHTGDLFRCDHCKYITCSKCQLRRHMLVHTKEKRFQCKTCEYKCSQVSHLTAHNRSHTGDKPFHCGSCELTFARRNHLTSHMRTHTNEILKCAQCKYKTVDNSYLKTHMRVHSGKKPFRCEKCPYVCARNSDLRKHMRIHTGDFHKCAECNYKTWHSSNLVRHRRLHTQEKPFQCNECDFKSSWSSDLSRHKQVHKRHKVKCDQCSYNSSSRRCLIRHIKSQHSSAS